MTTAGARPAETPADRGSTTHVPALRPSGAADTAAITWRGRTWTYGEFADLVATAPAAAVRDISRIPLPDALAASFAAAAGGRAVVVSDPDLAPVGVSSVPDGSWLLASTSGTSGHPRVISRTAASWAASARPLARAAGLTSSDRVLVTGPLQSTLHLHAAVHTLAIGAHLVDDVSIATAAHCVPAVLESLLRAAPAPTLRTVIVAGAALPDDVAERAAARGMTVFEYYGAAETSFVACRTWPDPLLRPFPGVELRTASDGTLWVRSPYLATGYAALAARPEGAADPGGAAEPETGAVEPADGRRPQGSLRRSSDGFVTVGDLVTTPPAGPMSGIAVRGRGTSAISVGGFTVVAEEVEAQLRRVPGVRAAAAVGIPSRRLDQVVAAVVELDGTRTLAEVQSSARALFAGAARPRRYVAVDRLPRTESGKIARAQAAALVPGSTPPQHTVL